MLFDYIVIENEKVVRLSEMAQLVVEYQTGHWDKGVYAFSRTSDQM